MENRICYIIGAGEFKNSKIFPTSSDLVIAADGGYKYCLKYNIRVDIIIGDFDSLKEIPTGKSYRILPKEKDETDVLSSIKYGIDKGYKKFVLLGVIGKRMEHSLVNISNLLFIKHNGGDGLILEGRKKYIVLENEEYEFYKKSGYFSVFSLSNSSLISIKNAKYELENYHLKYDFPIGIDNEFINKKVKIKINEGSLLLIY